MWPWNTNGQLQVPSNVTRIARAIKERSERDNIPQIVYYRELKSICARKIQ